MQGNIIHLIFTFYNFCIWMLFILARNEYSTTHDPFSSAI